METMIGRAKEVLFEPRPTFKEVDTEFTKPGTIWGKYVLPLALLGPLAGAIGRVVFGGALQSERASINGAVMYFVVSVIVTLLAVFVLAQLIGLLAPGFGGQKNDVQALKVAAYASTPALLAAILNIHPMFWWLSAIISLYSLYLLYLGLPVLMKVPKDRAMGYTAVVIILAVVIFLLERVKEYVRF